MVVKNLIGNALKFTPPAPSPSATGSITETCTFEVDGHGDRASSPNTCPLIFEMFRQADGSDRRSFSGVGLGLHIVRRLANNSAEPCASRACPGGQHLHRVAAGRAGRDSRLSA